MGVSINWNELPTQPSMLKEEDIPIQTDQMSINGTMSRNRINLKRQATFSIPIMSPTDYQGIISYFSTGSGIYYRNDRSNKNANGVFAFSGLPLYSESEYVQGGSLYRSLDVVIREI